MEDISDRNFSGEDEEKDEKSKKNEDCSSAAKILNHNGRDQFAGQASSQNLRASQEGETLEKHGKKGTWNKDKIKNPSDFQENMFLHCGGENLETQVEKREGQKEGGQTQRLEKIIWEVCACLSHKIMDFMGGRSSIGPAGIGPGWIPGVMAD